MKTGNKTSRNFQVAAIGFDAKNAPGTGFPPDRAPQSTPLTGRALAMQRRAEARLPVFVPGDRRNLD